MPISALRETDFDQQCIKCGGVRALSFDSVEVGVARESQSDAGVIPLPACPTCGATEFLLRSLDDEEHPSPGSYSHLHCLLVDTLHAELVKRDRLEKALSRKEVPVRAPAAETLRRWFKDGLKLPRPSRTEGGAM